ncbi:MAG TPA: amino acid permease [Acetobacteraceae bacterium]|nr:amino acid permease [Acetobacteraceae bacterium]
MTDTQPRLRRVLTFWPLLFYGLGVIVGAGIYVAIGTVIARAGDAAPFAFLLAGVTAAMTGLCYAELASRFPEAAGSVVYVKHAFGSDTLSRITGFALTAAVAISAASIARGAVAYLTILLPWPPELLLPILVIASASIAAYGVGESVWLAAAIGFMEIGGLVAATIAGLVVAPELHFSTMLPVDMPGWSGALSGAFIAFFAYIGFETLANLAEETKDPDRTLPRGILGAVAASVVLYVAVAAAVVLSDRGSDRPLLDMFEGGGAWLFACVGFLAVGNGVLVQVVMLARLFYGMARNGQLPARFGRVNPRTGTPVPATVLAACIVTGAAVLVSFEQLLVLSNAVTLAIFVLVDVALWRVHRTDHGAAPGFAAPAWVPPVAALLAAGLLLTELLG